MSAPLGYRVSGLEFIHCQEESTKSKNGIIFTLDVSRNIRNDLVVLEAACVTAGRLARFPALDTFGSPERSPSNFFPETGRFSADG